MGDTSNLNLRSAVINDAPMLPTPYGNVRALSGPPPLPQLPQQTSYGGYGSGYGNTNSYGSAYGNSYGYGGGYGNTNSYGLGLGYGGYGGFSGMGGYGGMSGGFGGYSRYGNAGPLDPEQRFIQMAEASSRPAFQSIESLVSAIGNIASMLDSTFFALTSSFRAILGVAANFGRLRSVFAQFWTTFALFRGLKWIYRKILYWLRLSNLDPSSDAFKKAFAEALTDNHAQQNGAPKLPRKGTSPWPVLAFISFIFTAPYLIMKLLGTVSNTAQEEARNPVKWTAPIQTKAVYDFQARNQSELTLRAGQSVHVAPREIQQTLQLLNTGWGLATINGQQSGIIPLNYVKSPQQLRQEQREPTKAPQGPLIQPQEPLMQPQEPLIQPQPQLMNLSANAFPAPPLDQQMNFDFNLAAQQQQPLGPPCTAETALEEGFA
ncbi:Pex13 [Drosophila busckii]|uniref:Peroxisomal membrane protein PEX13 n=2 Tax=Drosophila busckii TaxID=30019 RepID=A0A0M5J9S0_DROBS|nr:probable peroxisomal membrane protein PEX13 isoform X2 [Drosophila busckii]XP_017839641.1 probable peroxisomal membrane protein PEX13 isoform X2 [Drosophila busckii]ALC40856.1 Pex13 [Drosophila busckii]